MITKDEITTATATTHTNKWWEDDPTIEYNEACEPGDCYWVMWRQLDNMCNPHICDDYRGSVHEECEEYCQYEMTFGPFSLKKAQDSFSLIDQDYYDGRIYKVTDHGNDDVDFELV